MKAADECGHHVAVLRVVVVAGAVQVGGHDAAVVAPVLAVVAFTQFDAGYFGDGIGFVGGFQLAQQQCVFINGLGGVLGVNTAATQKQELLHTMGMGGVYDVGLHHEVVINKLSRVGVVGVNAAHLGCGQVHVVWLFLLKKLLHGGLVFQVQLRVGAGNEVGVALTVQAAQNCAADHTAVAGYKNTRRVTLARHGAVLVSD